MLDGTEAHLGLVMPAAFLAAFIAVMSANTCRADGLDYRNATSTGVSGAGTENGQHRAGHPERQACYAQPSSERHYSKGFVGGGVQFHGNGRFAHEGTWGRDYCGWLVSHRPWLNWSHGRRHQGGSGAYKTDGPKLLGH
jgi:hypothetical protein